MLKGQAKTDYQREYMRRYRAGLTVRPSVRPSVQPNITKAVESMIMPDYDDALHRGEIDADSLS